MNEIRCAVEFREDDSRLSPGRLRGTLLEYETQAVDRLEKFAQDSLRWAEGGVILSLQHNRQAPIVRFVPKLEGRELKIDIPLPDTSNGRDSATMVRNGTLQGLSVEFRCEQEDRSTGIREILKAELTGAALVDDPSLRYPGRSPTLRSFEIVEATVAVSYGLADDQGTVAVERDYDGAIVVLEQGLRRRRFFFTVVQIDGVQDDLTTFAGKTRPFVRFTNRQSGLDYYVEMSGEAIPVPSPFLVSSDDRFWISPILPVGLSFVLQVDSRDAGVSVQEIAVALRLTTDLSEQLDQAIELRLTSLRAVAEAQILAFAPRANAAVKIEATIRYCSFLFDIDGAGNFGSRTAFRQSGAQGLLAPYQNP